MAEQIREIQAAQALGGLANDFVDIPWRVPRALLPRDVKDKEPRVKCLRAFFATYQEESRK